MILKSVEIDLCLFVLLCVVLLKKFQCEQLLIFHSFSQSFFITFHEVTCSQSVQSVIHSCTTISFSPHLQTSFLHTNTSNLELMNFPTQNRRSARPVFKCIHVRMYSTDIFYFNNHLNGKEGMRGPENVFQILVHLL